MFSSDSTSLPKAACLILQTLVEMNLLALKGKDPSDLQNNIRTKLNGKVIQRKHFGLTLRKQRSVKIDLKIVCFYVYKSLTELDGGESQAVEKSDETEAKLNVTQFNLEVFERLSVHFSSWLLGKLNSLYTHMTSEYL